MTWRVGNLENKKFWQRFIVPVLGGSMELGRHYVVLHDDGILYSRDMIIKWEWKI